MLGASRHARQSVATPECRCRIDMRHVTDVYRGTASACDHASSALSLLPALPQTSPNAAGVARGTRGDQARVRSRPVRGRVVRRMPAALPSYPLAVNLLVRGSRARQAVAPGTGRRGFTPSLCDSGGRHRSIVLRHPAFEGSGFHALTQDPEGHFTLRPGTGRRREPGDPAGHAAARDQPPGHLRGHAGAAGRRPARLGQRPAGDGLASVYHGTRLPRPASRRPAARQVGSEPCGGPVHREPLRRRAVLATSRAASSSTLCRSSSTRPELAFWVPSQNPARARPGHGCVVVSRNLEAEDYWLPAGIYMDHWMLREGVPGPPGEPPAHPAGHRRPVPPPDRPVAVIPPRRASGPAS